MNAMETAALDADTDSLKIKTWSAWILKLPRELLDLIYKYLTLDEIVHIQLTCRKLYYGTPSIKSRLKYLQSSPEPDDRFTWVCLGECVGTQRRNALVCSVCRVQHPRSHFSVSQSLVFARSRICIGRLGRVYITPDHTMSFEELVQIAPRPYGVTQVQPTLHNQGASKWGYRNVPEDGEGQLSPYICSLITLHGGTHRYGYLLQYTWCLPFPKDQERPISQQKIKGKSDKNPMWFCPHVKFGDSAIIRVVESAQRAYKMGGCFGLANPSTVCCYCEMHAIIESSGTPGCIKIRITRRLGKLLSSTDSHWLAAVDNPSMEQLCTSKGTMHLLKRARVSRVFRKIFI